ncbi:MAG TPA: bacillithiol biosynthesis deacetylase BshB1 [Bryobacteraceae bacterium]|nr:bacillithiol biosynthesis deacetylase BshB1 [Bryobacteraceae bacterium]
MVVDLLAIAAHPDDVEQTCGGTLLRAAEAGYRTGVIDLTAGEMGSRGTPETRLEEARAAAGILKLAQRGNMRFPDTKLINWVEYREKLALEIRSLQPRTVILPYWEARHPDHYHAAAIGFDACFLAGLRKLDPTTEPARPFNVIYSAMYANVTPTFVVDITREFDRRMESLFAYQSQYGARDEATGLFPEAAEIRDRLAGIARFYGNLIGTKYGEPFVVKETMRIDDVMSLGVRSF